MHGSNSTLEAAPEHPGWRSGLAHMLGTTGTMPELVGLEPHVPMLRPEQALFFANDNVEPFERQVIDELGIAEVRLAEVAADPSRCVQ